MVKPDAQPGYGSAMLNRLEHSHLFISALDDKHEWFRYHHLFVDFLRHIQTEINPMEIPVLQKRAASWFEQNANLDKAFEYALASGDPEWAADLIERNIYSMIRTGEIFTLTHWMGKLPDEIISQRPRLSLPYAWGLIAAYRLDLARYWIEELKRQLDQYEHQIEVEPGTGMSKVDNNFENAGLWNLRGGLALCQSSLALFSGDIEKAAEFTQQAASVLKDENPFIRSLISLDNSLYFILSGDNPKAIESLRDTSRVAKQANNLLVMITSTCQLAHVLVSQGQLNQAWATLQKAQYMATGPDGTPLPLAGMVDTGFGEVLFERNNLDEAYIYLERGHQNSQPMWSFSNMDGMITLARLYQAKGEVEKAKEIMTEASVMALSTEVSKWDDTVISAVSTRLALQRHDLTEAKLWWVRGGYPDLAETIALESYPYHVFEYLQLTQARFLILSGEDTGNSKDIQRALNLLEPLLFEAQRFQRFTSQIEILILKAMAQFALGDERAKDILRQALALGEPEGYRRVFLDEGQRLKELLLQCRAAQRASTSYLPSVAFIQQLLEETPHFDGIAQASPPRVKQRSSPTVIETESGPPIALSMREMEVLRLIAEGKSNQEISAQLFLALNTVKRHAYNIYTKLEVRKRTHAVSKARQLGLIP
ncbi:MAG: hypothetical protein HPY76_01565 [Anaerolineae bacterium]|nr:hypothetical protein [Anaerolineae bacterium]